MYLCWRCLYLHCLHAGGRFGSSTILLLSRLSSSPVAVLDRSCGLGNTWWGAHKHAVWPWWSGPRDQPCLSVVVIRLSVFLPSVRDPTRWEWQLRQNASFFCWYRGRRGDHGSRSGRCSLTVVLLSCTHQNLQHTLLVRLCRQNRPHCVSLFRLWSTWCTSLLRGGRTCYCRGRSLFAGRRSRRWLHLSTRGGHFHWEGPYPIPKCGRSAEACHERCVAE